MIAAGAHIHADAQIHASAWIDADVTIEAGVKVWHFVHVLSRTHIGAGSNLGQNVMAGPDVTIGAGCKIQNNVALYRGVTLEDDVFCGPSCVFTNVLTPRAHVQRKEEFAPTHVGKGATIGANATIVCGNTLSRAGERLDTSMVCPRTGEQYEEADGQLSLIKDAS